MTSRRAQKEEARAQRVAQDRGVRLGIVTIPVAHLGHWYVQLAFAVPSLLLLGFMGRDSIRRRRKQRRDRSQQPRSEPERPPARRR